MFKSIKNICNLIVIQHSIFALPFALASFILAYRFGPLVLNNSITNLLIFAIICAVCARSAAMGFNRLIDLDFDRLNSRTADRELVSGKVSKSSARLLILVSTGLFILFSFLIGSHCGVMAPLVLLILFFYSFTKRFTSYSHFILGVSLSLAPGGAWWILRPQVEILPLLLMFAVLLWVTGFDIIYACQDVDFDRDNKLFSIPARLGITRSLQVSRGLHVISFLFLTSVGLYANLGATYLLGMIPIGIMFYYQHSLVSGGNLALLNRAFFTVNGWVAVYYLMLVIIVAL